MKTNRNELCPCGSGLKYKKCCWVKANSLAGRPTYMALKAAAKNLRYKLMKHYRDTGELPKEFIERAKESGRL